jgi:hypothetical protein
MRFRRIERETWSKCRRYLIFAFVRESVTVAIDRVTSSAELRRNPADLQAGSILGWQATDPAFLTRDNLLDVRKRNRPLGVRRPTDLDATGCCDDERRDICETDTHAVVQ